MIYCFKRCALSIKNLQNISIKLSIDLGVIGVIEKNKTNQ